MNLILCNCLQSSLASIPCGVFVFLWTYSQSLSRLSFFCVLSFKNTVRRKRQLYGVTQSFRRLLSHILLIWFLCLRRQHVFLWVQTCDLKWHQQKTLEVRFPLIVATFLPWHLLIFFLISIIFIFSPASLCDYQSAVKIWSKLMLYFVKLWHVWFFL